MYPAVGIACIQNTWPIIRNFIDFMLRLILHSSYFLGGVFYTFGTFDAVFDPRRVNIAIKRLEHSASPHRGEPSPLFRFA